MSKKSSADKVKPELISLKSVHSRSSQEEGDIVDYDFFIRDKKSDEPLPKSGEYYYQDYPYVKPTQSDYDRKQVKGTKLFDKTKKVRTEKAIIEDDEPKRDTSILVSGFGMRNVESFQKLIEMSQEERKKWELRKLWRDQQDQAAAKFREEKPLKTGGQYSDRTDKTEISTTTESSRSRKSSVDLLTQTETTKMESERKDILHLEYLLGLEAEEEEEPESIPDLDIEESEKDFDYSTSKSIREAQRYLRVHRIFECFQFIVSHLLSANAENPIEFILNLLNRCILYRSGLGEPPVLYEHKHIHKLFDLMDRMQTGFIDMSQYVTGMKTLGICSYNEDPKVADDGMVTKDIFIEETYDAELAIFDDMIKRRPEKNKQKYKKLPNALSFVSVPSQDPSYFIPSDLLKFNKSKDTKDIPQEGE